MKINLKEILFFGAGVCFGASASWLFMKKRYSPSRRCAEVAEDIWVGMAKGVNDEISATRERRNQTGGRPAPKSPSRGHRRDTVIDPFYKKIAKRYSPDTDAREAIVDPEEQEYIRCEGVSNCASRYSGDCPYVIGIEQFSEENDHFDKITLYYYEDDRILTEENEEIVVDVDIYVGNCLIDGFGKMGEDPEVLYVRNEKLSIDYEIIRLSKSYSKTVMGRDEDDE